LLYERFKQLHEKHTLARSRPSFEPVNLDMIRNPREEQFSSRFYNADQPLN